VATFLLTINPNIFNGGAAGDLFNGPGGGLDKLNGGGGNDRFIIDLAQRGSINGGIGHDKLFFQGMNNQFHSGLTITGVEEFVPSFQNIFASVAQLKGFTKYTIMTAQPEYHIFLQGAGGTLDFSTSYTSTKTLNIEANMTTSKVTITGSAKGDNILGSGFADTLNGGNGADLVGGGNGADIVNGELGKDQLRGDSGADQFLFNTALNAATNVDKILDFSHADDRFRLDNSVFSALPAGNLAVSNFKNIGLFDQDSNDRILYNSKTGNLFYDSDGQGGVAPILFANVAKVGGVFPVVNASDFFVI
jgi:Ca2+-binding RTX toxin-like protein